MFLTVNVLLGKAKIIATSGGDAIGEMVVMAFLKRAQSRGLGNLATAWYRHSTYHSHSLPSLQSEKTMIPFQLR